MQRPLRFLAAALVASLASPALATNGMRMTGFGAVQNGMGGVGVGATLDANAAVSNPAGLTELDRRFDASLTWFQPTVEYAATGAAMPYVNQDGVTFKSSRGGSPIPNLGAVFPLGHGFTAGLGAFGVGGMGVDYGANLYSGVTVTSYQNLRLAPAIAYRLDDVLSIGVALNLSWAQMKYDVASGFGQVPHDTANAFGQGVTVGLKLNPSKQVSIGFAYETRTSFQDFSFDVPAHTGMTPGGPYPFPGGTDKLTFHQPSVISAGLAVKVLPTLLLAADFQQIGWNQTNGANQPAFSSDTRATGSMPFNMTWKEQAVIKVGAEYQALPALKVRCGWNYGQNPLDPSRAFENVAFPAIAEHHLSLGAGYALSDALAINVAAAYAPKVTITGANPEQGITWYTTSMSQLALDLGVAWKF
jgi:long-chain fatty acid transport protein